MEELGGLQSTGCKESDTTERLHFHFQCLFSALTQWGGGGHFFKLTCSVALWGGRDAENK